jgi:Helix-turn-helix domain of transposase family ISL3
MPEMRDPVVAVEGLGHDPSTRYQDRPDRPRIVWRRRKWLCTNISCKRKSFTEATPAVPARARMTTRAKSEMACAVLDDNRSVAAVAAAYGCTWNICHDAVIATADLVLDTEPEPVTVLGIDEHAGAKRNTRPARRPGNESGSIASTPGSSTSPARAVCWYRSMAARRNR